MPSLLDKLQSKLELLRLEKRYTRSRHRRSHFVSGAVYVDGEYVFQTPNSTGSSKSSSHTTVTGTPGVDALHGDYYAHSNNKAYAREPAVDVIAEEDRAVEEEFQRKRMNRFSAMPSMSSLRHETESPEETHQRKKLNRFSSIAGFGRDYDVNNKALPARPKDSRRLSMLR